MSLYWRVLYKNALWVLYLWHWWRVRAQNHCRLSTSPSVCTPVFGIRTDNSLCKIEPRRTVRARFDVSIEAVFEPVEAVRAFYDAPRMSNAFCRSEGRVCGNWWWLSLVTGISQVQVNESRRPWGRPALASAINNSFHTHEYARTHKRSRDLLLEGFVVNASQKKILGRNSWHHDQNLVESGRL